MRPKLNVGVYNSIIAIKPLYNYNYDHYQVDRLTMHSMLCSASKLHLTVVLVETIWRDVGSIGLKISSQGANYQDGIKIHRRVNKTDAILCDFISLSWRVTTSYENKLLPHIDWHEDWNIEYHHHTPHSPGPLQPGVSSASWRCNLAECRRDAMSKYRGSAGIMVIMSCAVIVPVRAVMTLLY